MVRQLDYHSMKFFQKSPPYALVIVDRVVVTKSIGTKISHHNIDIKSQGSNIPSLEHYSITLVVTVDKVFVTKTIPLEY